MDDKVNLADKLASFDEVFRPKIVGYLDGYKLQLAKARGEFVWPTFDDDVELGPGELFVVPAGTEHCPKADAEAHILLIEPAGEPNTGDAGGDLTAPEEHL